MRPSLNKLVTKSEFLFYFLRYLGRFLTHYKTYKTVNKERFD